MDDLEFRRRCYENPQDNAADFVQKCVDDPNAKQLANQLSAFDIQLEHAMQVPVPTGLAARIMLQQDLKQHQRFRQHRRSFLTLAAGMVLGLGISLLMWFEHSPALPQNISQVALQHVQNELFHLGDFHVFDRNEIPSRQLDKYIKVFGGQFEGDMLPINFLSICEFQGVDGHKKRGLHMVLQGDHGAVTVLYVPNTEDNLPYDIADKRFHGEVFPSGKGHFAVLGEAGEGRLLDIKKHLVEQVRWQA